MGLKGKHKSEGHTSESPTENLAELQKLDSKVIKVDESEDDPFKHLPPDEAAILKRQVDVPVVPTSFKQLYRYATTNDLIIITISVFCAIAGGAALPLMTVWKHFWIYRDILAKTQ
jgi:ATP-binding cassette subfamily B (MDR/TAP) protein 1